jgi:hypothetical protein
MGLFACLTLFYVQVALLVLALPPPPPSNVRLRQAYKAAAPGGISIVSSHITLSLSTWRVRNLSQQSLPSDLFVQVVLLALVLPQVASPSCHRALCGRTAPAHPSALQAQQQQRQQQQRMAGRHWGVCCCLRCSHCRRPVALQAAVLLQHHNCR